MENMFNNNNDDKTLETDYIPFPFENSKNNSNDSSKIRIKFDSELLRNQSNKEISKHLRNKKYIFSNTLLRDSIYNYNKQFNNLIKDEATKLRLKMNVIQNKELYEHPFNDLLIIQSENKNKNNNKNNNNHENNNNNNQDKIERKKRKTLSFNEVGKNDLLSSLKIFSSTPNNNFNYNTKYKSPKMNNNKKFVSTEQQTIMRMGYGNDSDRLYSKINNLNNIDIYQMKKEDNIIRQEINNSIINSINYSSNNINNNGNITIYNKIKK